MSRVLGRPSEGLVQGLTVGIIERVPRVNGCKVQDGALGKVRGLVENEPPISHAGSKR